MLEELDLSVLPVGVLAHRLDGEHDQKRSVEGVGVAEDLVAYVRVVAAGDSEHRLAVDEVQAAFWNDDVVVHQAEASPSERTATAVLPLQLIVFGEICRKIQEKQ